MFFLIKVGDPISYVFPTVNISQNRFKFNCLLLIDKSRDK
jgi:hypothetical protein